MSNRCPISGKFVPRKNPSDGYLVLSPEGEEVRFCCPSHKTRYLRENPGSVELKGRKPSDNRFRFHLSAKPNPYEYQIPAGTTAKTAPTVREALALGSRRRLIRAGEVILPDSVVRFVFPKADGRFNPQDIQPEIGVFKVLVDLHMKGPDKLTPLGLWHRTFQGYHPIAQVIPQTKRTSMERGLKTHLDWEVVEEIARIVGEPVGLSPRTRWWRQGNRYRGAEGLFDAQAMAMTFPGGIVYGVEFEGRLTGKKIPARKLDQIRKILRPLEAKDTQAVRDWVNAEAMRGVVTMTSGDSLFTWGESDEYAELAGHFSGEYSLSPQERQKFAGILSILGENDEDVFPNHFGPAEYATNPRKRCNPTDLKGRHIPEKYLAGLSEKERLKRIKELGESRDEYGTGDWSELPSDRVARKKGLVKLSAYRKVAMKRGFDISQVKDLKAMARKALRYYTGSAKKADVEKLTADLEHVYDKGLAAWKSGGHRPGATATNWGDARVASLLVGGKAAWTADKKQANRFPAKMREAVIRQMPEVLSALRGYDNTDAVDYLEAKYAKVMRGRKR